jgi:hypothetical protein
MLGGLEAGWTMAIHRLPITEKLVYQLYELACTPFVLASFRARWDDFGWFYSPDRGDEFGFRVQIPGGCWLSVDPLGGDVIGASLPFYYWEDYDRQFHDNQDEYRRQRRAYDDEFETAVSLARRQLPAPIQLWTDANEEAHKAVVWNGDEGLLILQQACFDPQYGIEVNFWLASCSSRDFQPTTPLIDWLCKRSQSRHAEQDFPPLRS